MPIITNMGARIELYDNSAPLHIAYRLGCTVVFGGDISSFMNLLNSRVVSSVVFLIVNRIFFLCSRARVGDFSDFIFSSSWVSGGNSRVEGIIVG